MGARHASAGDASQEAVGGCRFMTDAVEIVVGVKRICVAFWPISAILTLNLVVATVRDAPHLRRHCYWLLAQFVLFVIPLIVIASGVALRANRAWGRLSVFGGFVLLGVMCFLLVHFKGHRWFILSWAMCLLSLSYLSFFRTALQFTVGDGM